MLDEVAALQSGVVSRAQALAAGLTRTAIAESLRSGRWQRVTPGIYVTFSGPLPPSAVLWAALLHCGSGAMLSHESAAEVAGLRKPGGGGGRHRNGSGPVHVTVPADRRVAPLPGLVVHRSRRADRARHPTRTPPQTRIEETVLDLVGLARDADEAIAWLTRACGQRLTTPERLLANLRGRRRFGRRSMVAAVLADVEAGCHSPLEVHYLWDVERRHSLPLADRQRPRVRPGGRWYDDVLYRDFGVAVELDGRLAHADEGRWRDLRRDNAAVADGISVLRYGAADLVERPCVIAAQVAKVLARRGWDGKPRTCGRSCAVASSPADRGSLGRP